MSPDRLAKCAIVDTQNWKCSDGFRIVGFTDGKILRAYEGVNGIETPVVDDSTRHVSKSDWLFADKQ
jgi:hypothetical protein